MSFNTPKLDKPVSFPKDDSEWHSFLDGRVDEAIQVREYIDSLPDTAAMFTINDIPTFTGRETNYVSHLLKLAGAWPVPEHIVAHKTKWVNPNYTHAHRYADVGVKCSCGTPVMREAFSDNLKQPAEKQEHTDCCKIDRMQARIQLLKNRKEIAIESYEYAQGIYGWHKRLGYPDSDSFGARQFSELDINTTELAKHARAKQARTYMVLARKHSTKTIGKLFGYSHETISRNIKDETVSDPNVLYSIRRANA